MSRPVSEVVAECNACNEVRPCEWTTDPFLAEVYGEELEAWWCEDCRYNRIMDI